MKRNITTYLLAVAVLLGSLFLTACRTMDCGCPMH